MQGFKDDNAVAELSQVVSAAQSCRTAADDGYLSARRGAHFRGFDVAAFPFVIGDKSFEVTDGDRFVFFAQNALFFTLVFLGADPSANRRQDIILLDFSRCAEEVAFGDQVNKFIDFDIDRTAFNAHRVLALNAAHCLFDRSLRTIAEVDLFKVLIALYWILSRHLLTGDGQSLLGCNGFIVHS